jgi:hypothetical protein
MEKSKFEDFLGKYYLAGNTDSAKIVIKDKKLTTSFITTDQNVIGEVTLNSFDTKDAELGVYTTSQLLKLLSALDKDIDVSYGETDNKVYSMNVKDKNTNVTYMLADLSVIRQVPALKTLPEFDCSINISKEFITKFIKAKNALPDSDNFAVQTVNGETSIVINYSSINTNRINFKVDAVTDVDFSPICFSAKVFKEILLANDGALGTLEISSKGLARVTFTNSYYSSTYYLVKLTIS